MKESNTNIEHIPTAIQADIMLTEKEGSTYHGEFDSPLSLEMIFLPFLIVLGGIRHIFFIMTKLPIWETTEGYRGLFFSHLIIEILRQLFAFDIILIM